MKDKPDSTISTDHVKQLNLDLQKQLFVYQSMMEQRDKVLKEVIAENTELKKQLLKMMEEMRNR